MFTVENRLLLLKVIYSYNTVMAKKKSFGSSPPLGVKYEASEQFLFFLLFFYKYPCSILYVNGLYTVTIQQV